MTSKVSVSCPDCGPLEIEAADITIRGSVDTAQNAYRFLCPNCHSAIFRSASQIVIASMVRSGAHTR